MNIKRCSIQLNTIKRELKTVGTPAFPIELCYDHLPVDDIPWHWHEPLEIVYVQKGNLFLGANSEKVPVREGEAFFINKEVLHSYWCEEDASCDIYSILFRAELLGTQSSVFYQNYLRHLIENADFSYCIFRPDEKWQREILHLRNTIWNSALNEEFGYEFTIRNNLSNIMLSMIRHMSQKPRELTERTMRTERRMKIMLAYITENYGHDIKIRDIAQSAAISESECVRCFHEALGISPIKYVKKLRLQSAAELLLKSEKTISEIAGQCGFQDMSYFTRSFRTANGVTPSQYRKNRK